MISERLLNGNIKLISGCNVVTLYQVTALLQILFLDFDLKLPS